MNATVAKIREADPPAGPVSPLARMREPFPAHHISKLPKPTKAQTEEVRNDFKKGVRCSDCGAWHHPQVVHLDYVGHAALTDRLLDTDPEWSWEPVAFRDGLPAFDATGGLWIKLTVCGVTRLGYGHAATKPNQDPGAREKEIIGDALRNAAMRFGAALDLWHKGDLHVAGGGADEADVEPETPLWIVAAKTAITCLETEDACGAWYKANLAELKTRPQPQRDEVLAYLKARKTALKPLPPREPSDRADDHRRPDADAATPFDDDLSVLGDDRVPF